MEIQGLIETNELSRFVESSDLPVSLFRLPISSFRLPVSSSESPSLLNLPDPHGIDGLRGMNWLKT